jgi:hypothetical protein
MQKLQALLYVIVCLVVLSCHYSDKSISIIYSDSDQFYTMKANFNKSKTKAVERYMEKTIGTSSAVSFVNTNIDETIELNDRGRTKLHIEKSPGFLEIQMDKAENSEDSYYAIKSMCEEIKHVVTEE